LGGFLSNFTTFLIFSNLLKMSNNKRMDGVYMYFTGGDDPTHMDLPTDEADNILVYAYPDFQNVREPCMHDN
jgi:hypothetical protein